MGNVDEVRRTLALYSRYNDEEDSAAWAQLWTENGSITDRSGTYVGRQAIKQYLDGLNAANPNRDMLHFCGNAVIALDGDTAEAHTDIVFAWRPTTPPGAWATSVINHYTDRLVRQGTQWLFEYRRIEPRPTVRTPLANLKLGTPPDDHEAIRRTLALYAQLIDSKDAAGWSQQFASNGVFHTRGGDHTGRAALERFMEEHFAREPAGCNTAHFIANPMITIDGSNAQVTSDCLAFEAIGGEPWRVQSVSRTRDQLVREEGSWRFAVKQS